MIGRQRDVRATSVYDGLRKASLKLEKRLNCQWITKGCVCEAVQKGSD
jgi:hypothetical protein